MCRCVVVVHHSARHLVAACRGSNCFLGDLKSLRMIAICECINMKHTPKANKDGVGLKRNTSDNWTMQGPQASEMIVTRFLCVFTAHTPTAKCGAFNCTQPQYIKELEAAIQR